MDAQRGAFASAVAAFPNFGGTAEQLTATQPPGGGGGGTSIGNNVGGGGNGNRGAGSGGDDDDGEGDLDGHFDDFGPSGLARAAAIAEQTSGGATAAGASAAGASAAGASAAGARPDDDGESIGEVRVVDDTA